jgi:hypothetical protein
MLTAMSESRTGCAETEWLSGECGSNTVLLTSLGGGAFGNAEKWIYAAMRRALEMVSKADLHVKLVSYGAPSRPLLQMAKDFEPRSYY